MPADLCHAETADPEGELQPCHAPAVGMRTRALNGEQPWPACPAHIDARYLGDGLWDTDRKDPA